MFYYSITLDNDGTEQYYVMSNGDLEKLVYRISQNPIIQISDDIAINFKYVIKISVVDKKYYETWRYMRL